jgi:hypothetical protein
MARSVNAQPPGRFARQGALAWVTGTVGGASLGMVVGAIGGWLLMLPFIFVKESAGSSSFIPALAQWLAASILLAFVAGGIATGQAMVLEPWLGGQVRRPWIVATTVAWVAGALLTGAAQSWLPGVWGFLFLKLLFGAAVGLGQFVVLRTLVPRAALWVGISAVSLVAAESLSLTGMGYSILLVPASALIYGALSGPVIIWLVLRQSAPAATSARPPHRAPAPDPTL